MAVEAGFFEQREDERIARQLGARVLLPYGSEGMDKR
jgi:hypothetical protein